MHGMQPCISVSMHIVHTATLEFYSGTFPGQGHQMLYPQQLTPDTTRPIVYIVLLFCKHTTDETWFFSFLLHSRTHAE